MRISASLVAIGLASLLLAACQYSPEIVARSVAYNQAVADSNNDVLLLNIMRASKRYPTYYSRLEQNNAISSANPQLGLSLPFSHSRVVTTAAAGVTNQLSNAAITLMPQLQIQETNQLQLQSLDDQKYISGMMTPISVDRYALFANAGWPSELLGLLFIQSITVDGTALAKIQTEVKARCDNADNHDSSKKFCSDLSDLPSCIAGPGGSLYVNDPALDAGSDISHGHPGAVCFQAVFRALLILGFHTAPAHGGGKFTVVQSDLPESLLGEPRFVAATIAAGQIITVVKGVTGTETLALCRSEKSGGSGASSSGTAVAPAAGASDNASAFELNDPTKAKPEELAPAAACLKAVQDIGKGPKTGTAGVHPVENTIGEQTAAAPTPPPPPAKRKKKTKQKTPPLLPQLSELEISVVLRSTEGVVYYLGQIARVDTSSNVGGRVYLHESCVVDPTCQGIPLFEVAMDMPAERRAVTVSLDGKTYSIPVPCAAEDPCTLERPTHRSLDVMTLVDELWGLQKETSTVPAAPAVTVINP